MLHVLHELFKILIQVGEFLVFTIFAKLILGRWIAEKTMNWLASKNERNAAIWSHFVHRFKGEGHQTVDVLECHQERCAIFG